MALLTPPAVRLGVLGWPVAHSRSPTIQNAALTAAGLSDWRYQMLPVPPDLFTEMVTALPAAGFRGVNVTIPHKRAALSLSSEATARARAIGAANTLTFEPHSDPVHGGAAARVHSGAAARVHGGAAARVHSGAAASIHADNTDAPALIEALPVHPRDRTVLVLGAGGGARAAVWGLLDAGAAEVRVWNRTPERAEALCSELGGVIAPTAKPADILVNCTSVGMDGTGQFAALPLGPDDLSGYRCVVDLVYTPTGTALVGAARERGIATVDGLELLVAQGALSFERFTGQAAPLGVMRAAAGIVASR